MLSPERWKQIETLLDAALDQPADARLEWLRAQHPEDPTLVAEVERLLAHANTDRFDAHAAEQVADLVADDIPPSPASLELGPYRLGEEIGRGGMGVVYRAARDDGEFQQDVVVKLLQLGIDDAEGRSRFRRERQILAHLTHEGITRLLDGGVSSDGRPYIVMEPVEGERIDRWCRSRSLDTTSTIELFLQVIEAVQFAHQNLIVHRDLKPSNVLVTESGRVKLLDFGIAKILDQDDPGATQTRRALMTPDYASPEQVRGDHITIASDVYQLGILLYELVTGRLPYDFSARSMVEVSRAVCETDPIPPRRARSLPDTREGGEPGPRIVSGNWSKDLDRILLKALEKDPAQRYASAREFANDLRRYLAGQPVLARNGGVTYRAGKFLRRNWVGVTAGLMMAVLLGGLGFYHTRRVQAERNLAQQQAAQKQEIADFLVDMFDASDASQVDGEEVTAAELLTRKLDRIDDEDHSPEMRARLLLAVGRVGLRLGLRDKVHAVLENAFELTQQVHGTDGIEAAEAANLLGDSWRAARDFEAALPLFEHASSIYRREGVGAELGQVLRKQAEARRDLKQPEIALREAVESETILTQEYGPEHPEVLMSRSTRAYVLRTVDRVDEAEAIYRDVIPKLRANPTVEASTVVPIMNNLAYLLRSNDRAIEAVPVFEDALELARAGMGEKHPTTQLLRSNTAGAHSLSENYDRASELLRERLEITKDRQPEGHWSVGSAHHYLGRTLLAGRRDLEARTELELAARIWTEGLGDDHNWTLMAVLWWGAALHFLGEESEARVLRDRSYDALQSVTDVPMVTAGLEWFRRLMTERGGESYLNPTNDSHHDHHGGDRARATHRFEDAEKWAGIWDHPSRRAWQEPDRVVELLRLEPGMTVVDIGAGTGYFNAYLSAAVGPEGRVYPVDIETTMVDYMTERARREETPNVIPVLGEADDPKIPAPQVDRILMVDTYHHIDHRRDYFRRLGSSLAPGGLFVDVDWKPGELELGPSPKHKIAPEEVVEELAACGFKLVERVDLEYQYVLVFERQP